jgi:hypothetical protein
VADFLIWTTDPNLGAKVAIYHRLLNLKASGKLATDEVPLSSCNLKPGFKIMLLGYTLWDAIPALLIMPPLSLDLLMKLKAETLAPTQSVPHCHCVCSVEIGIKGRALQYRPVFKKQVLATLTQSAPSCFRVII